jgi:hypothetical protein
VLINCILIGRGKVISIFNYAPHHKDAYRVEIQLHPLLALAPNGESDQLHTPAALSPGKSPQNPLDRRISKPQSWSEYCEEKNLSSVPGI